MDEVKWIRTATLLGPMWTTKWIMFRIEVEKVAGRGWVFRIKHRKRADVDWIVAGVLMPSRRVAQETALACARIFPGRMHRGGTNV